MSKLSVVLATYNEEGNIGDCLDSLKDIASEIILIDGSSSDRTVEIAKEYGAEVFVTENHQNFHINKQKAIEKARFPWILLMDADERLSKNLRNEILRIILMSDSEIEEYEEKLTNRKLFLRHQELLEKRDGNIGTKTGNYAGFFIPRLNYFLGGYLKHGGVYPDGVIRLVKNGEAFLPAHDVHEQIVVKGRVGWLQSDLLHRDSPTFNRYLFRNSRYIDLLAQELRDKKVAKNIITAIDYIFVKSIIWFLKTLFINKGILDGWRGVIFSLFSALRFPRAYMRYRKND